MKRLKALRRLRELIDGGKSEDEALEAVKEEFGAGPDWAGILEFLMKFLALLGPLL